MHKLSTTPKHQCYFWMVRKPRLQKKTASNKTTAFNNKTAFEPMRNSNRLAAPKSPIDETSRWNRGTGSSKDRGRVYSFAQENWWIYHSNICKLKVERPLPLHLECYHQFPFRLRYHQAQCTSCALNCPLAVVLSFQKTKTSNSMYFDINYPKCSRYNLILLHHGDTNMYCCFLSSQSIKASF